MKRLGYFIFFIIAVTISFLSCDFESKPVYRKQVTDFSTFKVNKDSAWLGHIDSVGIDISNIILNNTYDPDKKDWVGFACTNIQDTITFDSTNLVSTIANGGFLSTNYTIGKNTGDCVLTIDEEGPICIEKLFVSNTTFNYYLMQEGKNFFEKFGGADGKSEDWFKLKIELYGGEVREKILKTHEVTLANFTALESADDYIEKGWVEVDLSDFLYAKKVKFTLESNRGTEYLNTFCLDYIVTKVLVE